MHVPFHKHNREIGVEEKKETNNVLVCWICGARFENPAEYLWHLQVCGVAKERGMPLKYDKSISAWRLDLHMAVKSAEQNSSKEIIEKAQTSF